MGRPYVFFVRRVLYHTNLLAGLLSVPGKIEKVLWYFMTFCKPHWLAFRVVSHDLNTMTAEQVTEFMQVQWLEDKARGKLVRLREIKCANRQRHDSHGHGQYGGCVCSDNRYKHRHNDQRSNQRC